jgi:hypothetical protein|eukprot:6768983-Prymnesium_polylepis.1
MSGNLLPAGQTTVTLKANATKACALAEELATDTHAVHLHLTFHCGDKGAAALGAALKVNSSLRSLHMQCNQVKLKGISALSDGIGHNRGLLLLDLGGNELGDEGGILFAAALAVNHTLISVGVQGCGFGEAAVTAIAAVLKSNRTLEGINFGMAAMGSKGMLALADALTSNSTLRHMCCDHVEFEAPPGHAGTYVVGVEALKALASALEVNTGLISLRLNSGRLGDEAYEAFGSALRLNRTLRTLHAGWHMTSRGCAALAAAMEVNTSLYSLMFEGVAGLAEADKAPIAASCQRNKEAVIAAQKAGEQPQIDNMLKCFNWMRAFPLLKSHLEAASAASTSTSASNETVQGVGKKRAGATQTKPPAKKQAKTKPPAKKQAKPK